MPDLSPDERRIKALRRFAMSITWPRRAHG